MDIRTVSVMTRNDRLRSFMTIDPKDLYKRMIDRAQSDDILKLLKEHVVRFNNLDMEDEQGEKRAATVDDLYGAGEFALCMEIFMDILMSSQLTKEKEKNSESPSGSQVTNGEPQTTTAESASN